MKILRRRPGDLRSRFGEVATGWIVERSGERSLAGHYLAKKCRVDASTANDTN